MQESRLAGDLVGPAGSGEAGGERRGGAAGRQHGMAEAAGRGSALAHSTRGDGEVAGGGQDGRGR